MTKVDNSYLERLAEVLYDDKKVINYKGVSIMLGVHVNIAKQMLYHFYKKEKDKGKSVYATYFLSGMLPRRLLSEFSDTNPCPVKASHNISDELDAFLVLVCRDKDLERYKEKFSKIFSIHIYALSGFPLENFDPLEQLAQQRLVDSEGRTPVDFGPIVCSRGLELRKDASTIPKASITKVDPAPVKKAEKSLGKKPEVSSDSKPEKDEQQETPKTQKKQPVPPIKDNKDRLKNMFATAATKPRTKSEPKPNQSQNKDETASKTESRDKIGKERIGEKKYGDTRKRKRIRDVLSSDSEEEEANKSDDGKESDSPESPLPKRLQVIESDSDDDFKESPKKPEVKLVAESKTSSSGRRRVSKTISKSYVDKDGFLVTTKEQVMVSEDDEDGGVTNSNAVNNNVSKVPSEPSDTTSSVKSQPQVKKPEPQVKSSKAASAPGKPKQASLMSFFKKK